MTDATPLASEQITQEDREAAISTVPDDGSHSSYMMVDAIERGAADDWPLVQAFARHRIAALSATPAPSDQANAFYAAIAHGDEDHRAWLREACDAFFSGRPVPPPRGKGTAPSDQDASQAQGEVERLQPLIADILAWRNTGFLSDGRPLERYAHDNAMSVRTAERKVEADALAYIADLSLAPGATAQDGEYTAAASNEAFLDAIHKATPSGQWIAVQHAPDGSGWSVALHPLPWLPGGEVAVKVGHENTEADAIASFEHLNCPACGGSGHIDDTTPTIPAGMVAVIERLEALMAKATKRPWRVFDGGAGLLAIMKGDRPSVHSTAANKRWPEIVKWAGFDGTDVGRRYDNANAELMVEAVNALPELLNALRSLAAAPKQAEQQGVEEAQAFVADYIAAWEAGTGTVYLIDRARRILAALNAPTGAVEKERGA